MPLINCEVELILPRSANCVIIYTDIANQDPAFELDETNLYVPVVTLSTQDNAKLLPQLKSVLKGQSVRINICQNRNYYLKIQT